MVTIAELFAQERETLARTLAADRSLPASVYAARNCLDRVKQEYISKQEDQRLRAEAAALFAVARRTLSICEAVQETQLSTGFSLNCRTHSRLRLREALSRLFPSVLCMAACLVIFFSSKSIIWIIVGIGAASLYQAFWLWPRLKNNIEPPQTADQAKTLMNTNAILTTIELICSDMDNLLSQSAQRIVTQSPKLVWTKNQLIAAQILWEALRDKDGNYALSAIPSILNGLENQGVHIKVCSPETASYFETVPAESDGVTVRPAFLADGVMIAHGHVTASTLYRDQIHAG